jgi:putative transposase
MTHNRRAARLPPQNYPGRHCFFVTICCNNRQPLLQSPDAAKAVLNTLLEIATTHNFQLHAYCLMPDHAHILAESLDDHGNLLKFIRLFKQRTAFAFRQSHNSALWEMSYHDRILRNNDSVEQIAAYIWQNPVRKNLCEKPAAYPFSGSQTIPWMQKGRCSGFVVPEMYWRVFRPVQLQNVVPGS